MKQTLLRGACLAVLLAAVSSPASAGELKLTMQNGRVTLVADNVPVRQILQEWARVGQTRIVNAEKLNGPGLTLQLVNMPERDALDIILRAASGYIAAPRETPVAGGAMYDRITIFMATARPPAQVASVTTPPPTFQRPPQPDDSDEPINIVMPQPNPALANPVNGQYPGMPQMPQQQPPPQQPQAMPGSPLTSPRPGALPQPSAPTAMPNPYQPQILRPVGPGGPGGPGGI